MNTPKKQKLTAENRLAVQRHSETAFAVICFDEFGKLFFGVNIEERLRHTEGPLLFAEESDATDDAKQWDTDSFATVVRVRVTVEEIRK